MRRVVCREFGPPDGLVLAEAPDPEPGPGQVLVGVRAAGVSFVDGLMAGGLYQVKPPLPFTPGLTAAGEVLGTGDGVPGLPRGSRVVGCWFGLGGYATHWLLPASTVVRLPDSVTFQVAATAVESYATMLFALTRRTVVRAGEWVLVLGAGGGIGLAAVDVAVSLGARVIAAASSPAKRAAAVSAGAQAAVDYQAEDLRARVREITGAGADLVVNPVGDRFAEPALRSLRGSGRYLVLGFAGGAIPRLPLNRVLLENRTVVGVDWGAWSRQDPAGNQVLIAGLLDRVAAGTLHPVAPATYPLERAAEALSALAGRQVTGKLALLPLHVQAPVDRVHLARYVPRLGVGRELDDPGDLGRLAEPAGRNTVDDLVHGGGRHGGRHVRGDEPGRDRVDRDPLGRRLQGQAHRQAEHAGLGGGVVGLPEPPGGADDGGDVDDTAVSAVQHVLQVPRGTGRTRRTG